MLDRNHRKLKLRKNILEIDNVRLQTKIKMKYDEFKTKKFSLKDKRAEIIVIEKEIAKYSKDQQGTMVPKGIDVLLRQVELQRELLAYALKTLEVLHNKHGC